MIFAARRHRAVPPRHEARLTDWPLHPEIRDRGGVSIVDGVTDEDRGTAEDPRFAGWGVLMESPTPTTFASVVHTLGAPGARRWYFGAGIALLWLISVAADVLKVVDSPSQAAIAIELLVIFGVVFALGAPSPGLCRSATVRGWPSRPVAGLVQPVPVHRVGGHEPLDLCRRARSPWRSIDPRATLDEHHRARSARSDLRLDRGRQRREILTTPAIIVSISLMMAAFARQLADSEPAARHPARDDPPRGGAGTRAGRARHPRHPRALPDRDHGEGRARRAAGRRRRRSAPAPEIAEVEDLARGALADVRSTVAGFRGVNVDRRAGRSAIGARQCRHPS